MKNDYTSGPLWLKRLNEAAGRFTLILMVFSVVLCMYTTNSQGQTTVFTDNFDRGAVVTPLSNGGTPTMTWTTVSTITPPGTSSTNLNSGTNYNALIQNNSTTPVAGRTYITGPLSTYSAPFNTTLASNSGPVTWTFNMKTNRSTALSGFDGTNYGLAVALVATSADLMSADGYAVVMVKAATNNALKLVRFAGGLDANANLTTIIGPSAELGGNTRWASIKVIYTPSSNTWQLFVRDDVSTTDPADPTTGTLTQVGSNTVNTTYTSTVMSHCGFFFDHGGTSAASNNTGRYDNFTATVTPVLTATLNVGTSTLSGFNYIVGSGPSASQSFALSGVNLDGSTVTVTGSTDYEVATDLNPTFSGSVTVPYTAPTLGSTLIHVRLIGGLPVGNYNSEIIGCSGGGAGTSANVTCDGYVLGPPATFTWTGSADNDWQNSGNWSPARSAPAINDILQFNDGGTYTITNVPTQTIAQLLVSSGTKITLQAPASAILTIAGTTGDDLAVGGSGSELNISGTFTLSVLLNTGTNGIINGSMTFGGAAHTLKAVDAGSLVYTNGSVFKATTGFTGSAFGTAALNSVKFQAGSTYIQDAGSNPFGAGAPNSVLTFETGSLYKFTAQSGGPSYSGRTYANFENDSPLSTQNNQGSSPMTCDNYTVTSGIVNWDFSGGMVIKGNISVNTGATLTYGNATKVMNLTLSGTVSQSITNAGTLTFGANSTLVINNPAGVTLANDIAIYNLNFQNGKITTGVNTLSLAAAAAVTGAGAGKYIYGNELWNIATGASSKTFDLGDATNYTPVTIALAGVSTPGTLAGHTTAGDHPDIANSGINITKSVNRYWSFAAGAIDGYTYDATFSFVPSDLDPDVNTSNFAIRKFDGSAWSATTTGTLTATSSQATGLTSFSDFQIGELSCITPAPFNVTGGGAYCSGGPGMPVGLDGSETGVEYQLYLDGTTPAGTPVAGSGTAISFGNQTVAGIYTVIATRTAGGCSNDMTGNVSIMVNPLPGAAGIISGPSSVTQHQTGVVFSVAAIDHATGYDWSLPSGATISDGDNTNSITVSFSATAISGVITVTGTNPCGNGTVSPDFVLTVQAPEPLMVSGIATDVSCNGDNNGTIGITVSGGTPPYGYVWNTEETTASLTGLFAGPYTVTVTDTYGATVTDTWVIQEPETISFSATFNNVSCFGGNDGNIFGSTSGGTPPYSYIWGNGETTQSIYNLPAGSYSCQIIDANYCYGFAGGSISEPSEISLSETIIPASCPTGNDGSINLIVTGGTPDYTFIWSNGATTLNITGLAPANYTVTVTDGNNCVKTATLSVGQTSSICADISVAGVVTSMVCYNATNIIMVAESAPFTIQADGHAEMIAGVSILYKPGTTVVSGGYMYGHIGGPWCGEKAATIVTAPTGEADVPFPAAESFFKVYPNPTSGTFTLELTREKLTETAKVEVYGMQGEKVLTSTLAGESKQTFTLDGKQPGCYFIRVICDDKAGVMKIIKQ